MLHFFPRAPLLVSLACALSRATAHPGAAPVTLVDYDDMALLKKAPVTLEELLRALGDADAAACAGRADEPGAHPAVVAALEAAWAAAEAESSP